MEHVEEDALHDTLGVDLEQDWRLQNTRETDGFLHDYHRQTDLYSRQYELEMMALQRTIEKYREITDSVVEVGAVTGLSSVQRLMARWFGPLEKAIDKEQKMVMSCIPGMDRKVVGHALVLLPPDKLAALVMHETLSLCLSRGGVVKFVSLAMHIGRMVQAEVGMQKVKSERRKEWQRLQSMVQQKRSNLVAIKARNLLNDTDWSQRLHVRVCVGFEL